MELALALMTGLFLKHFICDFLYQPSYMYLNKGTFLHPGGLAHSGFHAICTFIVFAIIVPEMLYRLAELLLVFEFLTHYFIDLSKVKINRRFGLTPTNSQKYWWLLGFDQLLHCLTYVVIVYFCIKSIK